MGLEFAGVETVFEGIGAAGLPARATRGGDKRNPFGMRIERLTGKKTVTLNNSTYVLAVNGEKEVYKKYS